MNNPSKLASDRPFYLGLALLIVLYSGLIIAIIAANIHEVQSPDSADEVSTGFSKVWQTWSQPEVKSAIRLSLFTSTISSILALFFAVPIAYALARFQFRGRAIIDALLNIPMLLPPLVIGLSLLILFNKVDLLAESQSLEKWLNNQGMAVTFAVPAIILAQFTVITAYAIAMVRNSFLQIDQRAEQVALTLGCNQATTFWKIALPQAGPGILAAGVMAWARAMGEFGPILVFAGATRGRTEVLPTSIFLELNMGNIQGAAAISLLMMLISLLLIGAVKWLTRPTNSSH